MVVVVNGDTVRERAKVEGPTDGRIERYETMAPCWSAKRVPSLSGPCTAPHALCLRETWTGLAALTRRLSSAVPPSEGAVQPCQTSVWFRGATNCHWGAGR